MKIAILSVLTFIFVGAAQAAQNKDEKKPEPATKKSSKNLSFDDLLIQGNFHFSNEYSTTVEEDKVLDSLLSIRKDFKDRIKRSASAN